MEKDIIDVTQRINSNAVDINFNPYPNLDYKYGPYTSINEALMILKKQVRSIGLTIGIIEDGVIQEYWFKQGINDSDLVIKIKNDIIIQ